MPNALSGTLIAAERRVECNCSNLAMWISLQHIFWRHSEGGPCEFSLCAPQDTNYMAKEKILKAEDTIFLLKCSKKKICKSCETKATSREPSKITCYPVLAFKGWRGSTVGWVPQPPWTHGPTPTLVSSNRDKRTVFPEDGMCMFTGIWFPFYMPYREF